MEEKALQWWPTAAKCYAEWLGAQIDAAAQRRRGDADADTAMQASLLLLYVPLLHLYESCSHEVFDTLFPRNIFDGCSAASRRSNRIKKS